MKPINTEKQIKKLEQKLLRQQEMYEDGIYDRQIFHSKRKETMGEISVLKEDFKKNELRNDRYIIEQINDFIKVWEKRWEIPLEYRTIVHTLIKEMYSDGKDLEVFFYPFNIAGWREHVKIQL
jgi:hypothetical protein